MKIYPPFPTCREATPTRRAEKLIYETLEASELDGLALYEVKPLSSAPQLDFAVWILDVGTFGIQTKGGRYIMIDGEWRLVTDRGQIRKESPIPGTWDAAMAIHDLVQEQLRHKTFVIPVLVLTDMEPDAEIEALAAARNVAVHWGSPDNLVEHLVELAAERKVYVRPTSAFASNFPHQSFDSELYPLGICGRIRFRICSYGFMRYKQGVLYHECYGMLASPRPGRHPAASKTGRKALRHSLWPANHPAASLNSDVGPE